MTKPPNIQCLRYIPVHKPLIVVVLGTAASQEVGTGPETNTCTVHADRFHNSDAAVDRY